MRCSRCWPRRRPRSWRRWRRTASSRPSRPTSQPTSPTALRAQRAPFVSGSSTPSARRSPMSDDRQIERLREVMAAFNGHDLDAIMSHFREDCVFESPRGPDRHGRRFVGKDEVRRGLAARFEGIPNVQLRRRRAFRLRHARRVGMDDHGHDRGRCHRRRARVRPLDVRRRRTDRAQGQLLEDPRRLAGRAQHEAARIRLLSSGAGNRCLNVNASGVGPCSARTPRRRKASSIVGIVPAGCHHSATLGPSQRWNHSNRRANTRR